MPKSCTRKVFGSASSLESALASACVLPDSSREYPPDILTGGLSNFGQWVTITHPTENAPGTALHLRASSMASFKNERCIDRSILYEKEESFHRAQNYLHQQQPLNDSGT